MAVQKMQKINICALKEDRKRILEYIQRKGCIEISKFEEDDFEKMNTATQISVFERSVVSCENALEVLSLYSEEKSGMFDSLKGRQDISEDDFLGIEATHRDLVGEAKEITDYGKEIDDLNLEIAKAEDEITAIEPWIDLDVPMNTRGTRTTDLILGIIPGVYTQEELLLKVSELENFPEETDVKVVSSDEHQTYISVICDKDVKEETEDVLRKLDFTKPVYFTHHVPTESIRRRKERITTYNADIENLTNRIKDKADLKFRIEEVADYYRVRADKYRVLGDLEQSKHTFFMTGAIPENEVAEVKSTLEEKFTAYVEIEDYVEEEAPVYLKNSKFSGAVEGVVTAFGFPNRFEIDPTTITSFFYYFLFGIMLSDAAYGLIMFLVTFIVLKKYPNMSESLAKSLRMFMYCGISTLIWGILFGGYFGDAIPVISKTFFGTEVNIPPLWFEPIANPMRLLIYCMIFGIIHLFTGLGIKGYMNLKNKDVYGFFADAVVWYMFLIGLILLLIPTSIFGSLAGTTIKFPGWLNTTAIVLTLLGMVGILVTGGRGRKNPVKRALLGVYSLYDVTSWLSDLLSYSRLLALGLATGVIASVINTMAAMGGKSVIGVILFVIIFIIGHTFNMAINLLGAYVHTNRLQFVEFFGKFYEGGGREFTPFKENTKYVKVKKS